MSFKVLSTQQKTLYICPLWCHVTPPSIFFSLPVCLPSGRKTSHMKTVQGDCLQPSQEMSFGILTEERLLIPYLVREACTTRLMHAASLSGYFWIPPRSLLICTIGYTMFSCPEKWSLCS